MARLPTLIMGTSGHVDHGKTTLVKSLTGVDLDTLPEEKARGLTINLGFTSFDTPSGHRIGVVDVPGHRKFVRTMLSGAHGLDFVLFIVACDDSVMPQTREHLQILRLFGVKTGIVVLTKADLVEPELRELVEAEVSELVEGTFLERAPMVAVSSVTGEGMGELIEAIDKVAGDLKPRERGAYFRMFVDRSFTVAGAGTVVTGTVLSGSSSPGDEVEILPGGHRARVRKIESHGEAVDRARAGQRAAVNLRLLDKGDVGRGDMIATPEVVRPTYMVDVRLEVQDNYPRALQHWTRVRFYVGTHESFGRVVLLEKDSAEPGGGALAQIRLETPAPVMNGDPFIIRDFSSSWTIGGGKVLDSHPTKHKRRKALAVGDLARREDGYLEELIELEAKKTAFFLSRNAVALDLNAPMDRVGAASSALAEKGDVVLLPPRKSPWIIHQEAWRRLVGRIKECLSAHHESLPQLDTGLSEQELRERVSRASGARIEEEPFHYSLERLAEDKVLKSVEATYALSSHAAVLEEGDEQALAAIRASYVDCPMTPPATEEVYAGSGLPKAVVRDFLERLLEEGELVRISREFIFDKKGVSIALEKVLEYIRQNEKMTVAEFRDLVGTSRKYAIPLLNYFDNEGWTVRDGDFRKLGHRRFDGKI